MAKQFLTALLLGFGAYNLQGCGDGGGCGASVLDKKSDCDVTAGKDAGSPDTWNCDVLEAKFKCVIDMGKDCCDVEEMPGAGQGTIAEVIKTHQERHATGADGATCTYAGADLCAAAPAAEEEPAEGGRRLSLV